MKKLATLKFPTLTSLWLYRTEARLNSFELCPWDKTLLYYVSDEGISLAVSKYNASVICVSEQ